MPLELEPLVTGKKKVVLATHLLPSRNESLYYTLPDDEPAIAEHSEMHFETVAKIRKIGEADDGIFLQVVYYGLSDKY